MKVIKLKFADFWKGFNPHDNFFLNTLSRKYEIVLSDEPDYLIYSTFDYTNLNYENCIKIFYTGENLSPDFNICDYAIGFDYITFGDRYLRLPLYVTYGIEKLAKPRILNPEVLLNRKFCSYVVSSAIGAPERNRFFHLLSEYKQVDSGGRCNNNVGGPVPDKLEFIKNYKFSIAFENSMYEGYTTEKIMEPMLVDSLPIYWGNRLAGLDFNPRSFINAADFDSLESVVEYIVKLDTNDEEYLSILQHPCLNETNYLDWEARLLTFFGNIFDKPFCEVRHIPQYGYSKLYLSQLQKARDLSRILKNMRRPKQWFK